MSQWVEKFWSDYEQITPDAKMIYNLLESRGERIVNDHIALRTLNGSPVSLKDMAELVKSKGYISKESYYFGEKHIAAIYLKHPDPEAPRIFISELLLEGFSSDFKRICNNLLNKATEFINQKGFTIPSCPWGLVSHSDYQKLMSESEYGSWVAAFGICANHFTISVNDLKTFDSLDELNSFLKDQGFLLNNAGGEIKGDRSEFLMQSSTMAKTIDWDFSDGTYKVAGGYYEFAQRFPTDKKVLFDGFILKSANKIFESTDMKK